MNEIIISVWHHNPFDAKAKRLQEAAIGQFAALPSRKSTKKAIQAGRISVNGETGCTSTWVKMGDRLNLKKKESQTLGGIIENHISDISVLWEDNQIACVVKLAGIVTKGHREVSLELLASKVLKSSKLTDALDKPIAVHRLDKATHGLVLIAKTISAADKLGKAFEKREIFKTYVALIEGNLLLSKGVINLKIDGKTATTEIEVLSKMVWPVHENATLIKATPKTGRTHQIRRHLAALGHPIIGDNLYCNEKRFKGQGLFLACTRLEFSHPISRENIIISCKLPRKFKKISPQI